MEFFFARSSNLAPPLIWVISALASSSFSTRMWRARYSVPPDWPLYLSYSAWTSASVTGFLRVKSANSSRISSVWRANSICCLYSGVAARPRFSASCRKISRSTTSSRTCCSSSGVLGWPLLTACVISASTRALGTALPLTMAMFCACAASGAASSAASANEVRRREAEIFMVGKGTQESPGARASMARAWMPWGIRLRRAS